MDQVVNQILLAVVLAIVTFGLTGWLVSLLH
jgi:hypothetical protein